MIQQLITNRLKLIPLSLYHLSEEYVSWMNDKAVIKHLESGGNYTLELLKEYLKEQEKKQILFWAIHLKSNNKHIGNIKIDPIVSKSGEYGIMIGDKNTWGKGYAKEASIAVINYCFEQLHLKQITLGVLKENKAALKLYEKVGFFNYKTIEEVKDSKKRTIIRMKITNGK